MKQNNFGKALIKECLKRGYIKQADVYYPPNQAEALNIKPASKRKSKSIHTKTGWIDDTRNIANKAKITDMFCRLVKIELGLDVWPEFHFLLSPDPDYRFDYAIPVTTNSLSLKIAIEVEGGIWAKGNSGHSSGKGIERDMKKSTLANVNGWTLIRVTPSMIKNETGNVIKLIKKAIDNLNQQHNYSYLDSME